MSLSIEAMHHVALPVPNIDASEEWYCRVLNGTVAVRNGVSEADIRAGRTRQVWIKVGTAIINLAEGPKVVRPDGMHFFHYAMTGLADDLEAWIEHLEANDVKVLGPYGHGGAGGLSLYFDDPDGYRLEIVFELGDYATAKAKAIALGGALGNPDAPYQWNE
jgi:catechol 2,3-dioxygenase-like lactoylglutathione lyase family enzyme